MTVHKKTLITIKLISYGIQIKTTKYNFFLFNVAKKIVNLLKYEVTIVPTEHIQSVI